MEIREYFSLNEREQAAVRNSIGRADWRGARFLQSLLEKGELRSHCGETTRLLLAVEGETLAAFCTLAEHDEVESPLTPWIGFVYTFPAYRGRRLSERLIEHACALARRDGHARVFVSTSEVGLYEKYGFTFLRMEWDAWGGETRVYVKHI